ncbi:Vam6 vps39-like protein [Camponotus japonicus]
MVRMCKVKGCKTKQGQGKLLFTFPKDSVMRKLWISKTGRTQSNPKSTSCICENHFNAVQWEKVRVDGSRKLRRGAVPSLPETDSENIENLPPLKSHDHDSVSVPRHQLFQDLKNSSFIEKASKNMSCISSDCNNNEMLPDSSATDINSLEKASFDTLSAFANICSSIEPLPVPAYNIQLQLLHPLQQKKSYEHY